jgi:hypothetical protein
LRLQPPIRVTRLAQRAHMLGVIACFIVPSRRLGKAAVDMTKTILLVRVLWGYSKLVGCLLDNFMNEDLELKSRDLKLVEDSV